MTDYFTFAGNMVDTLGGVISVFTNSIPTFINFIFSFIQLVFLIIPNVLTLLFWVISNLTVIFLIAEICIFAYAITVKDMRNKMVIVVNGHIFLFKTFIMMSLFIYDLSLKFINAVIDII